MKPDTVEENKKFHEWWDAKGYKYEPETADEMDWVNIVRFWAWKAWEGRAQGEP